MNHLEQFMDKVREDTMLRIRLSGRSIREPSVICPYCYSINEDEEGFFTDPPVDQWETGTCASCERLFDFKWSMVYSTRRRE